MQRSARNPILTRADIPDVPPLVSDVSSVFNPGAVALDGRYVLLLRVQTRGRESRLMAAESEDGVSFTVLPRLVEIEGIDDAGVRLYHVYDPRITRIGSETFVAFVADSDDGSHPGIARMRDVDHLELVSLDLDADSRNVVLFPERIGGRYLRLERPNRNYRELGPTTGEEIHLAESADLVDWRPLGPVMAGRWRYWDELIGSGPPPVKTRRGWLHIYHGVATHFAGAVLYQAGVSLLDLEEPAKLIARGRDNVLEPRELYEMVGQVPNVVFPSGMIVERTDEEGFVPSDSSVRLYYGAADTCVCMAETTIGWLLDAARP